MMYKTLPKPSGSNKQVQEYVDAARKGLASLFVRKLKSGWHVYPVDQTAPATDFAIFETENEAIKYAQKQAQAGGGEVFLYGQDGDQTIKI